MIRICSVGQCVLTGWRIDWVLVLQEGVLVLKCFQLLADALDKTLTLEQVLVPNFHKQIEAMLKCMSESKVRR